MIRGIDITHQGFEWALAHAALSIYRPDGQARVIRKLESGVNLARMSHPLWSRNHCAGSGAFAQAFSPAAVIRAK